MNFHCSLFISLSCAALLGLLAPLGLAAQQAVQSHRMIRPPDLVRACSQVCPKAKTEKEAFECVEKAEKQQGENSFRRMHYACSHAHEMYEAMMHKREHHGRPGTVGVSPEHEPYRHG